MFGLTYAWYVQTTMLQVAKTLGGTVHYGQWALERVPVKNVLIATLDMPGVLEKVGALRLALHTCARCLPHT